MGSPVEMKLSVARMSPRQDRGRRQMVAIQPGQCGLCTHYGEHEPADRQLIQIRLKPEAPESIDEECGYPRHAPRHLKVTPISGCAGFEPAPRVNP